MKLTLNYVGNDSHNRPVYEDSNEKLLVDTDPRKHRRRTNTMKKLIEHTYGMYIYMKLEIDGKQYEVSCYLRNDGEHIKTTADGTPDREKVIKAFNELY